MEQETITPGRGSAESARWFRDRLAALGLSQAALARLMVEHGDNRQMLTVVRSLARMASGEARVSGEMRALLERWRCRMGVEGEVWVGSYPHDTKIICILDAADRYQEASNAARKSGDTQSASDDHLIANILRAAAVHVDEARASFLIKLRN